MVEPAARLDRPVTVMEVCGTHTVSIHRSGLDRLLPDGVRLLSGPGCPVCVTPTGYIDRAMAMAEEHGVRLYTFGDLLKVPGSAGSLADARARGADVTVVASPEDALRLVSERGGPSAFLAVGFETTAPTIAAALLQALRQEIDLTALCAMKLIPPAMEAVLEAPDTRVDAFLCPGHVAVITGLAPFRRISERYGVPCVVGGFEPAEIATALRRILEMMAEGQPKAETAYPAVREEGNPAAREMMERALTPCDAEWRGLGVIPDSGLGLAAELAGMDAARRWPVEVPPAADDPACLCGEVLTGSAEPPDCPLFGDRCTPRSPVGPCMVSSEGSCAAWFRFGGRGLN
jgi:hydrogenase expression/formation protein HypD